MPQVKTRKPLVTPTENLRLQVLAENEWCTPQSVDGIEGYAFKIKSSHDHQRGNSWVATIYLNGEPQFAVENGGNGGGNDYYQHGKWSKAKDIEFGYSLMKFQKVAKLIYPEIDYEQADVLCTFLDVIANALPEAIAKQTEYEAAWPEMEASRVKRLANREIEVATICKETVMDSLRREQVYYS